MYKKSDFTQKTYKVHEVAELLGVTTKTIRNYDKDGKLNTVRTEGNHRMIMRDDLIDFLQSKGMIAEDIDNRHDVLYARMSPQNNNSGDLDRQVLFLLENVQSLQNPLVLKEVGSGLNDNRVQLQKLLKMVCNNEVRNVYITYKDRLTRFGYQYLETIFLAHNVNIVVVKDVEEEKEIQTELAEDMLSLIENCSDKLSAMGKFE